MSGDDYLEGIRRALDPTPNPTSPAHYAQGTIEPRDFFMANPHIAKGFFAGNIIKYTYRFNLKDGLGDLRKARVYLDWLIELLEKEATNGKT